MSPKTLITAWKRASHDQVPLLAAGVAFYGFLALFPAIIAGILLYGLVASPATVAEQSAKLTDALPSDAASLVAGQMEAISSTAGGSLGIGLVIAILVAIWSASGGIGNLVTAINDVFGCEETRGFVRRKAIALGLTLGAIVFIVFAIGLVAFAPAVFDTVDGIAPIRWLLEIGRWALLLGSVACALNVLYRVAPDRDSAHTPRSGVLAATAIWLIASLGFSLYVDNFGSYGKTYGALAGVVALLLWLWVSAYAVLFGAEIETVLSADRPDSRAS
ncbi:MAG: YihY/virulence factor BrkB family protein [Aeromicrobium sp.]